jgi:hypothetical protein
VLECFTDTCDDLHDGRLSLAQGRHVTVVDVRPGGGLVQGLTCGVRQVECRVSVAIFRHCGSVAQCLIGCVCPRRLGLVSMACLVRRDWYALYLACTESWGVGAGTQELPSKRYANRISVRPGPRELSGARID